MRRLAAALLLAAMVLTAPACGSGGGPPVAPASVALELAPKRLLDQLKLYLNTDKRTVTAFANAGEDTLVADGRVWEIRRADRLIGTLQISTVLPKVDLTDQDQRDSIVGQIVNGEVLRLRIDDVEVYETVANDKATLLWFGADMLEIVQVKDRALADRYQKVASEIIAHQATVPQWKPLPLDVESA